MRTQTEINGCVNKIMNFNMGIVSKYELRIAVKKLTEITGEDSVIAVFKLAFGVSKENATEAVRWLNEIA